MNGKIDGNGWLRIHRGNRIELQQCPFSAIDFEINDITIRQPCGDWCPLFGEPFEGDEHDKKHGINQCLTLCHTLLEFNEFTDERNL